jgi:uncharacterized protein (DUF1330 family)
MMAAYVIVDIDVRNPENYKDYLAKITSTVAACNGRYLVRGAQAEVISGNWQPKRLVVMEFPDFATANHWASCAEYAPIHALRNAYANANMIIVEGSVDFVG